MARTRSKRRTRRRSARTSARMLRTLQKTVKSRRRVARTRRRKYGGARGGTPSPALKSLQAMKERLGVQQQSTYELVPVSPSSGEGDGTLSQSLTPLEQFLNGLDPEEMQQLDLTPIGKRVQNPPHLVSPKRPPVPGSPATSPGSTSSVSSIENLRELEQHVREIPDKAMLSRILDNYPNLLEFASVVFRSEMEVCKSALNSMVENNLSPKFINVSGMKEDECSEIIKIISGSAKLNETSVLSCLSKIVYFYPGLFRHLKEDHKNNALIVDDFLHGISRLSVEISREKITMMIDNAVLQVIPLKLTGTKLQIAHTTGNIKKLIEWCSGTDEEQFTL